MNFIQKLIAYLRLRTAISQADKAYAITGKRHYVLPLNDTKPKLIVIDRKAFRRLRTKGGANPQARIRNLIQESFYHTPYIYGQGRLTPDQALQKRRQYFDWYEAVLKAK